MSVTVEELRAYVGTDEDSEFVDDCLATGQALVTRFVGTATVPTAVLDNAVLIAASEIFHRRSSPQGVMQMALADGVAPVRAAKDPLSACYPILQAYVGWAV